MFTQDDVLKLFSNKFILMLGDSNMRAMYKDIVYLLKKFTSDLKSDPSNWWPAAEAI